ncbi:MAG: 50S ribosomal protein L28 [Deltaproteobacteria bacterium]|nr:50S ribosomal protein L28 [Deltaproteobacteria bacterium]
MARTCDFCAKRPTTGNLISHSNIKTRTRWLPNLKRVKHFTNGATLTVYVCTRCIKSGMITKPPVRRYKPTTAAATK